MEENVPRTEQSQTGNALLCLCPTRRVSSLVSKKLIINPRMILLGSDAKNVEGSIIPESRTTQTELRNI